MRDIPDRLKPIALVSAAELARALDISPWKLAELKRCGSLPQSIKLAGNCHRWRVGDIETWLGKLARAPHVPVALRGVVKYQHLAALHVEEGNDDENHDSDDDNATTDADQVGDEADR